MPVSILLAVVAWILAHPQESLDAAISVEEFMVRRIEAAIAAWRRYEAGFLTDEQLHAKWQAEGVKVDEALYMWKNKPLAAAAVPISNGQHLDAEQGGSGMPDPLIGERVAALEAAVAALSIRLEAMERGRPG